MRNNQRNIEYQILLYFVKRLWTVNFRMCFIY